MPGWSPSKGWFPLVNYSLLSINQSIRRHTILSACHLQLSFLAWTFFILTAGATIILKMAALWSTTSPFIRCKNKIHFFSETQRLCGWSFKWSCVNSRRILCTQETSTQWLANSGIIKQLTQNHGPFTGWKRVNMAIDKKNYEMQTKALVTFKAINNNLPQFPTQIPRHGLDHVREFIWQSCFLLLLRLYIEDFAEFSISYLFGCKPRLVIFFHHFVRPIIKGGFYFFISLPYRKV